MQVLFFFFSQNTLVKQDALITPDKLVSTVSYGNVTDLIVEHTHICEYRLQK